VAIDVGESDFLFVLTGAGVSAESGIPTFRGAGGLWEGYRIEEVACPEAWEADPELVWKFYSWRRQKALACRPNPAHVALAEVEKRLGERMVICTQNVDELHEAAGSRRVLHMHGRLFQSRCEKCERPPFPDTNSYETLAAIPRCACGGRIRPHICWFGEVPFHMEEIFAALGRTTVFVSIGTSGVVYPAAAFVQSVRARCGKTVYIGLEAPENLPLFAERYLGKARELVPRLLAISDL
jgi:NAD-dependent deacetylase